MNLLMHLAAGHIPAFMRKRELHKLLQLTASAFQTAAPSFRGLTYEACLDQYARFTRAAAEQALATGAEPGIVQERLFSRAREYGRVWRKRFRVTRMDEVMLAGGILYRAIGIDFCGAEGGEIEIRACFFSRYYSPAVCRVVSALDAGLMAGLSGGRVLTFSQRITEGSVSCSALLEQKERIA